MCNTNFIIFISCRIVPVSQKHSRASLLHGTGSTSTCVISVLTRQRLSRLSVGHSSYGQRCRPRLTVLPLHAFPGNLLLGLNLRFVKFEYSHDRRSFQHTARDFLKFGPQACCGSLGVPLGFPQAQCTAFTGFVVIEERCALKPFHGFVDGGKCIGHHLPCRMHPRSKIHQNQSRIHACTPSLSVKTAEPTRISCLFPYLVRMWRKIQWRKHPSAGMSILHHLLRIRSLSTLSIASPGGFG